MIVVFLGPPGSGKGTQAEVLREQYGFTHFDTGSQLRAEVASGSELGQRIATFINAGQLVPLEVIKQLVVSFLRATQAQRILFDGFPRNLEQAGVLDEGLAELGSDLDFVVYLDADPDALLERIINRRFCQQCGAIYNLLSEAPKQAGKCDKCGVELTQRKDDTAEVFGTRLKVYLGETKPLIDMYRSRGLLHAVDALQGIGELTEQITRLLGWRVALKLKSARDLAGIYRSGQIAGAFLRDVEQLIKPGVTTKKIDDFGAAFISKHGATAAFLGYNGFPASLCISINEEIVHGIPGPRRLEAGDIVSIDVGVVLDGYVSDTARTYLAGGAAPSEDVQRLLSGTADSLACAIAAVRDGIPLRLVSRAVEQELLKHHLGIVHELTGHGTGFALHEEPTVYNFDPRTRKPLITNGMVLAIEPMATLGSPEILLAADNWCYKSADGSLAAHYEHTLACWDGRAFVLTDPSADDARQAFGRGA